ncbi:MAG: carboxypeptidase regulatory-like domain-containing protein [Pirellulaceae bacterium]
MHCLRRWIVCAAAVLGCTGCDGTPQMNYDSVDLVPVYGKVTLDGKPLPEAVITFEGSDGQFSYALTDANGEYRLQFDTVEQGATPGAKTVRISTTRKILGLNAEEGEQEEGAQGEGPAVKPGPSGEKVPARYNKKSELHVQVAADKTEFNFELVSR